jgi:acylglycerol lipase
MQPQSFSWQTQDNQKINAIEWQPDRDVKGVIALVHGLGEHMGRYEHVANFFTQSGYALIGFDQRGHGLSDGPRGHSSSLEATLEDINRLLTEAQARNPGLPCFLYGHSMGGAFVLDHILKEKTPISGLIVSSPGLSPAVPIHPVKILFGKIMYHLYPTLTLSNGLDLSGLSRDTTVVQKYCADPLVHDRVSARLGLDLINSGNWVLKQNGRFPLPLLIMHGSLDRIASAAATRQFTAQMEGNITFKLWDGFYHELHNEPEKETVLMFMLNWINNQSRYREPGL